VLDVHLDGTLGDHKRVSDLAIAPASGNQLGHLTLAPCQNLRNLRIGYPSRSPMLDLLHN
jgi:hypothetical protein